MRLARAALVISCALACVAPARGDESAGAPKPPAERDPIAALLLRARMTHEPDSIIREAVELLDARLDAEPRDAHAWLSLAEALAIGFARSRHADSPLAARRKALELAPDDCHVAALVARDELSAGPSLELARWKTRPASCAEVLYLLALGDRASEQELLERSRAQKPSAEGLVAIGRLELRRAHLDAAQRAYEAALTAPALFPEDWRVDGWTQVHAHLGLAVVFAKRGQPKKVREHRKALHDYLDDPGPWHDLSDEEKKWARAALHERLD